MEYPQRWLREHKAVPSAEGWRRPTTKELLKSQKGLEESNNDDILSKLITGLEGSYTNRTNIKNDVSFSYTIKFNDTITEEEIEKLGGEEFIMNYIADNTKVEIDNKDYTFVKKTANSYVVKFNYEGDDEKTITAKVSLGKYEANVSVVVYKIPRLTHSDTGGQNGMRFEGEILNDVTINLGTFVMDTDYIPKNLTIEFDGIEEGSIVPVNDDIKMSGNYASRDFKLVNFPNNTTFNCKYTVDGLVSENIVSITS